MSCGWRAKWLRGVQRRSGLRECEIVGGFRGDTPRLCSVSGRHAIVPSGLCAVRDCWRIPGRHAPALLLHPLVPQSLDPSALPAHLTIRLVPTTKETRHRRSGGSPVPHRPNAARCLHGVACPTPPSAACPNPTRPACPNPPGAVRPNPPNPARIACRNPARVGPILPIWNLLAAVRSHRAAVRRYPAAVRSDPTLLPRLTRCMRNRPWRPLERARRALGAGG